MSNNSTPNSLERIADALESIAKSLDNLDSIEQSLDQLSTVVSDCQVKNRYNSSLSIVGTVDHV